MRRFLIDSRNQPDEPGPGGSYGTQRNSNENEPREVAAETQLNLRPQEIEDNPDVQTNLEQREVPNPAIGSTKSRSSRDATKFKATKSTKSRSSRSTTKYRY
jgi:hypothetical protein